MGIGKIMNKSKKLVKIFIASSLKGSFLVIRKELEAALIRLNLSVIMWEKDRPGGSKISEGEKYMIAESIACVFLLGSEYSEGTFNEYNFARDLEKLIILVDATSIEGKKICEMDAQFKKEMWDLHREKSLITLTWTQSDEVARQIIKGISLAFPEINVKLEKSDWKIAPYCPKRVFLVNFGFRLDNSEYPLYKIPNIELGIENLDNEPITNCQIKMIISSRFLTDKVDLYWIFSPNDPNETIKKTTELEDILTGNIGKTLTTKYSSTGKTQGEDIEIIFEEKFDLAPSQIFAFKIPLYVEVRRFKTFQVKIELVLSSNETGRLNFRIPLLFNNSLFSLGENK